jgi:hypothetical protein
LAQATPGRDLDGKSLLPLLAEPKGHGWNRAVLIACDESTGIATQRYRYMQWGFHHKHEYELYDMTNDPYQLNNQIDNPAYVNIREACATALASLQGCSGQSCSWTGHFPPPPK